MGQRFTILVVLVAFAAFLAGCGEEPKKASPDTKPKSGGPPSANKGPSAPPPPPPPPTSK